MKKKIFALGLLAAATVGLVACGPENPVGPVEGGIIDTPTEIYVWTTAGDTSQTILNRWVNEFKQVEPNVKVTNVKQSGGYDDLENMIITGFTGNNYPDLAYCYPDHVSNYIDYGRAVKLDDYIDNEEYGWTEEEKADFVDAYLAEGEEYTIDGTWSLPFSKSTEAMFYNREVLVNLDLSDIDDTINGGLPLTDEYLSNLTWEELFGKLAPALLRYDAEVENIIEECDDGETRVFGYDSDDNLFITLAKQYGFDYTTVENGKGVAQFNNDGMKDLMKKFNSYYQNNYFITKGANNDTYVNELFTANQLLFSVGSTGGITYQFSAENPMDVGVAPIPHAEGKEKFTIMQGPSMCILDHNDDNRALASWLFYKFITEADNTLEWALNSTGYSPIRESNFQDPLYLEAADVEETQEKTSDRLIARGFGYYSDVRDTFFTSPAFKGSSQIRTQVGGLLTNSLLSSNIDADIDKLFQDALDQSNIAIGK